MNSGILVVVFVMVAIIVFIALHRTIKFTFNSSSDWKKNDQPQAINMLLEDISKAKERILLLGGRGDTYNDERILEALGKKDIPIEMIFENPNIFSTPLSDLAAKKSNIFLGFITASDSINRHFRVVDYSCVYIEKWHPPDSRTRYYKRFWGTRFLLAKYAKLFNGIKTDAISQPQN